MTSVYTGEPRKDLCLFQHSGSEALLVAHDILFGEGSTRPNSFTEGFP